MMHNKIRRFKKRNKDWMRKESKEKIKKKKRNTRFLRPRKKRRLMKKQKNKYKGNWMRPKSIQ